MATQFQVWAFSRSRPTTMEIHDDAAAPYAFRAMLESRGNREAVAWWPNHDITHVLRDMPGAEWTVLKGVIP